ncbi:MAG: hypothetical protein HOQ02_10095 [Lysobacter sp.]|nr:hypothetical protein [Lysobacter sp.]
MRQRARVPRSLDAAALARVPGFRHWFRYPLHAHDFRALREDGRLLGYYAAKPLYGRLDAQGRVDRNTGFDGRIAALFVPSPARSWRRARVVFARAPRARLRRAHGQRNWPLIHSTVERALRRQLQREQATPL